MRTKRSEYSSTKEFLTAKKCLLKIHFDRWHEGRAVAVAMVYANTGDAKKRKEIVNRRAEQRSQAIQLMKNCSDDDTINIFKSIQQQLGHDYKIELFIELPSATPSYTFSSRENPIVCLRFLLSGSGSRRICSVITSIKALQCKGFHCEGCNKTVSSRYNHWCRAKNTAFCSVCHRIDCRKSKIVTIYCKTCQTPCNGASCIAMHQCTRVYCDSCQRKYPVRGKRENNSIHICWEKYCRHCKLYVDRITHRCYLKKTITTVTDSLPNTGDENDAALELGRNAKFLFFDFETFLDIDNYHQCFLIVCQRANGDKPMIFNGPNCLSEFCDRIFRPEFKDFRLIGFNNSRFDNYILMRQLRSSLHKVEVCVSNGRMMQIKLPDLDISIIDLVCFVPSTLAQLPNVLGLNLDIAKSFFPYKCMNHNHYALFKNSNTLPEKSFFDPHLMSDSRRHIFNTWYEERINQPYNLHDECLSYCKIDVDVLRIGSLKFRYMFLKSSNLDPLAECMTISQACLKLYVSDYMPSESIPIIPHGGLLQNTRHSTEALTWLSYVAYRDNIQIQHARNCLPGEVAGEKIFHGLRLDGFRIDENNQKYCYEYYGDIFHGCPLHCPAEEYNNLTGRTNAEALKMTKNREKYLINNGFKLITIWSCEWKRVLATDEHAYRFVNSLDFRPPMDPRDGVFGGRVSVFRSLVQIAEGDENMEIQIVDATSLYPSCMALYQYPNSQPVIKVGYGADTDISRFTCNGKIPGKLGMIYCRVLPPKNLLIPLLPTRIGANKSSMRLFFTLCYTCSTLAVKDPAVEKCQHSDFDRSFTGIYFSVELQKALRLGYQILNIFETWEFESSTNTLFTSYVSRFFKLKTEASGYPSDNPEERQKYVNDFKNKLNISLDLKNIKRNDGYRSFAKLALNCVYGKLQQRGDRLEYKYCDDLPTLRKYIFSGAYDVRSITEINEQRVLVEIRPNEDFIVNPPHANCYLAAMVTSYARLSLYKCFEDVSFANCVYSDTDSLCYVSKRGETPIDIGCLLGQYDYVLNRNCRILGFAALGAKSYSILYIDVDGTTKEKTVGKGMSSAMRLNAQFSFKGFVNSIKNKSSITLSGNDFFRRNIIDSTVRCVETSKVLKPTLTKRIFHSDFTSTPFGFNNGDI